MNRFDPHVIGGLHVTGYVFDECHRFLAADIERPGGPNIGCNGENLTISFLSLNRHHLSLKLLRSMEQHLPHFKGEVLIIDNGSIPSELSALKAELSSFSFRTRVIELDRNYGVGGGRNRTLPHVNTEWVMFIDNDIYLLADFLGPAQFAIAQLGCHFLNLPLLDRDGSSLFSLGGHLYTQFVDGEFHLGAGSVYPQGECSNRSDQFFLSTFIFGGASILNCKTFMRLGGFDEGMFVGFEDLDFSIRVFREGLKVGNLAKLCFVHEHEIPTTVTDHEYERNRFSRSILKRSAEYFEGKHGIRVWGNGVDEWLAARNAAIPGAEKPESIDRNPNHCEDSPTYNKQRLPKIALITDTDDWAFSNISKQIRKHLAHRFEFVEIPTAIVENIVQILTMTKECDLVHIFWRETANLIQGTYYHEYLQSRGIDPDRFRDSVLRSGRISTCVYDHLGLGEEEIPLKADLFNRKAAGYYVSSQRLNRIYRSIPLYRAPLMVLEDGVDLEHFRPKNLDRFLTIDERDIVVGWSGNSKWASNTFDFKGLHSILRPALNDLRNEGYPIVERFADRAVEMTPHSRMPDYYNSIDLYVCPSMIEGTPNPILESMACGVPVVTTDVGVVPELFGSKQREFILTERSVECLKAALRKLFNERHRFAELSAENLRSIEPWDWKLKTQGFEKYFDTLLEAQLSSISCEAEAIAG